MNEVGIKLHLTFNLFLFVLQLYRIDTRPTLGFSKTKRIKNIPQPKKVPKKNLSNTNIPAFYPVPPAAAEVLRSERLRKKMNSTALHMPV